jgi:hypothetical protein
MAEISRTREIKTTNSPRKAKLVCFVLKADAMSSCHCFMRPLLGRCQFGTRDSRSGMFHELFCWFSIPPLVQPCSEALNVEFDENIQVSLGSLL